MTQTEPRYTCHRCGAEAENWPYRYGTLEAEFEALLRAFESHLRQVKPTTDTMLQSLGAVAAAQEVLEDA